MTRLAIFADIHGNLPALEAALDDAAKFAVDHIIIAGDLIHKGPFPAQVTARVIQAGCAVIRGNNEYYLLDYRTPRVEGWRANAPFLGWLAAQMHGRLHAAIAAWPDEISLRYPDAPPVRVVHAVPGNPWGFIDWTDSDDVTAAKLAGVEETTIVGAHTHLPLELTIGEQHFLNPGSVGLPLDGVIGARYMLLDSTPEGWKANWRVVSYDTTPLFAEFERLRFVERFGVSARLFIEEFRIARPVFLAFSRWRKTVYPDTPATLDMVETFLHGVDFWDYMPTAFQINPHWHTMRAAKSA